MRDRLLSRREYEIARLVSDGRSNLEIAVELGIGLQTVKNRLHSVYDKTGCRTRVRLALLIDKQRVQACAHCGSEEITSVIASDEDGSGAFQYRPAFRCLACGAIEDEAAVVWRPLARPGAGVAA